MKIKLGDFGIRDLCFRPDSLALAGIAASEQGLWKTTDGWLTWQNALAPLYSSNPVPVTSVLWTARPGELSLVIAGIHGGILRSEDDGLTWEAISFASPLPVVTSLTASEQGGLLFAGTADDGVFLSKDNGRSWARWNFGLYDRHVFSLAVTGSQDGSPLVFAGTETGIFASHNQGRTWKETDYPMDAGAVLTINRLGDSGGGEFFLAGTETGAMFRSTDRGRSWTKVDQACFNFEIGSIVDAGGIVAASGEDLWVSRDFGDTWLPISNRPLIAGSWTSLAAAGTKERGLRLFAGTSDGEIHQLSA